MGPFSLYLFLIHRRVQGGLRFYAQSCGLSTCVFALDELDSIGPRGSGSQPVPVDFFFNRFLGVTVVQLKIKFG